MEPNIRRATFSDLNCLLHIYKDATLAHDFENGDLWHGKYPFDHIANDILKEQLYILEKNNEVITSFVLTKDSEGENLKNWEDDKAFYYIHRFVCNVKHKGKGFGKLTFKMILNGLKEREMKFLRLHVVSTNPSAIGLYKKTGFIEKGRIEDRGVINGACLICMECKII